SSHRRSSWPEAVRPRADPRADLLAVRDVLSVRRVPGTGRARLAAGGCAAAALLLAGCHVSATVAIRVRADGRGAVSIAVVLDREARLALAGAALKPGNSTPDVPLDDLRAHGWSVSSWRPAPGGGAALQ